MGKLLRLRDYIIIGAAFAGEIFEEARLAGGLVPMAMKGRYGYVPSNYKRRSYLTEVSDLLSTGDIKREIDLKGRTFLVLTSVGKKKFTRRFRLIFESKKWDGYFMVVVFDIPEEDKKTREVLRRKLRELGFGMLQKSVWVTAYHFEEDLREFLVIHGLESDVFVLSAKNLWAGNVRELSKKIWNLNKINKKYLSVVKKVNKIQKSKTDQKKQLLEKATKLYLETLLSDPLLPKELLPSDWARQKALRALNQAP